MPSAHKVYIFLLTNLLFCANWFCALGWLKSINMLKMLGWLYQLKEKWCPAFCKDVFFGGILSSQRSESTKTSLLKIVNVTLWVV